MSIFDWTGNDSASMESKIKLAHLHGLPSLPTLLMDALQHTSGNANLIDLAGKIGQDPHMLVRILRIANSPFYGMSREIDSLREAIVLLGLDRVKEMVLGVCFLKILPLQHKDFDYRLFWHHSMAVASCTQQLAAETGIGQDVAFTAGLLHDIGLLGIVLLFPDDFSRIISESSPNRLEAERRILGVDHANIGGQMARYWNLSLAIQEAIEQHESPPSPSAKISLGLLIYTANLLVKSLDIDPDSALNYQEAVAEALNLLKTPIEQATQWAENSRQFADQIVAIF